MQTIRKRNKILNFKELGCLQLQSHSIFRFTGGYQRCKHSLVAMSSCYPHSSNSLCSHRTNELLSSLTTHTWTVLNQQWYWSSHCISCTELQLRFLTGLWMHYLVLCRMHVWKHRFRFADSKTGSWVLTWTLSFELYLRAGIRTCSSQTIILSNSSQGLGSLFFSCVSPC